MRRPCACGQVRGRRVAYRYANGSLAVRHECLGCGALSSYSLPGGLAYAESLPLARDNLGSAPPCERCGALDVELHHWAPACAFEDSGAWPVSWLCRRCHRLWHEQTGLCFTEAA